MAGQSRWSCLASSICCNCTLLHQNLFNKSHVPTPAQETNMSSSWNPECWHDKVYAEDILKLQTFTSIAMKNVNQPSELFQNCGSSCSTNCVSEEGSIAAFATCGVIVTTDLWAVTMAFTFPKMKFDTLTVPSLSTPMLTVPNCSWVCCVLWQLSALLLVSYTDHKMQLLPFRDLACLNPRKLRKQSLKQGCLLLLENVIQQLLQTWKLPCRCTGFLKGC